MKKRNWKAIIGGILAVVMVVGTASAVASAIPDPEPSEWKFYLDGELIDLEGVGYGGHNYLKLRDFAKALDIGVEYDDIEKTVELDTSASYVDPFEPGPTPQDFDSKPPFKVVTTAESDPNYWQEQWEAQVYNYKMIKDFPTLYIEEAWENCMSTANTVTAMDPAALTETNKETLLASAEAFAALDKNQLHPYIGENQIDGEVIYIWDGDNMPILPDNKDAQDKFVIGSWDNADFKPFIIPYLIKDQSKAKGTVILVSGGGNQTRSNTSEAYDVAPVYNELNYNCFVLQRRVEPYVADEIAMDLQRTVRYIKYYAEEWGLDLENTLLAISGYSGGGGNIMNMINNFYGDITPDQFDPDYVCDEIDAVNSDVDVAQIIYATGKLETENPNLPYMFIAVGEDDNIGGNNNYVGCYELFKQAQEMGLNPELHVYAENGHGFGAGFPGTGSVLWIQSCDLYMQKVTGHAEVKYEGEVPPEFTLKQTVVVGGFPSGEATIDVYMTADRSEYFITFLLFNNEQVVRGTLIGDRVASVTFDKTGYIRGDAERIFEACDPAAWEVVGK